MSKYPRFNKGAVSDLFLQSFPEKPTRAWIRDAFEHVECLLDDGAMCRNMGCRYCLFVINLMSSFKRRMR